MKNYSEDASKQYHTQVGKGDVGRYVLMPGDPRRCKSIARYLDDAQMVADNREYTTYTGTLDGVKVSVTSTGIGGPSTAIAMEELSLCGADTFVRVGTCGGMQPQVKSGDLIIATGAVRMEGTTREYAPIEFPAVPSHEAVSALIKAAGMVAGAGGSACPERETGRAEYTEHETKLSADGECKQERTKSEAAGGSPEKSTKVHIGVVQSKDSFYGQHDPEGMPVGCELIAKWEAWKRLGCLASEMESAAIFIVAAKLHARAGACFLVMANQEREKLGLENPVVRDTDLAVRTAVEAVRILIQQDRGRHVR